MTVPPVRPKEPVVRKPVRHRHGRLNQHRKLLVDDQEVFVDDHLVDQRLDVVADLAAGRRTHLVEQLLKCRIHRSEVLQIR